MKLNIPEEAKELIAGEAFIGHIYKKSDNKYNKYLRIGVGRNLPNTTGGQCPFLLLSTSPGLVWIDINAIMISIGEAEIGIVKES